MNITKGEYVFKAGETAEAIYFILEGSVLLLGADEKSAIAHLGKNDVFGELFTLEENLKVREVIYFDEDRNDLHPFLEKCTSDNKHIFSRTVN